MGKDYVLTITAANRIGILAAVSNAIAELGGDIRELRVSVMGRFFTIILSVEFPEHREPGVIADHLKDIGRPYGLEIMLKEIEQVDLPPQPREETEIYYLTLSGSNQKGLMRRIASRLAQDGIDILDLFAVRDRDTATFKMLLELAVPVATDRNALQSSWESLHDSGEIAAELQSAEEFQTAGSARPLRTQL